jgi:hypothetical protein
MNVSPHTTLLCPHCYRDFRVAAWRVTAGSSVTCRCCGATIAIDHTLPDYGKALSAASDARDRFHARIASPSPHRPASQQGRPVRERLDDLVRRLKDLARN